MKQTKGKIPTIILGFFSSLPNYVKMLKIKPLFSKILLTFFLFFSSISGAGLKSESEMSINSEPVETQDDSKAIYVKQVKDKIYQSLYFEVDQYMKTISPTSGLNSAYLTQKCLEYDIDIVFVLAQGILESHLGTKGKASITNSVWNVGTYDNGQILYTYADPNQSVEPYLDLLKKKYLINITAKGDTIYKDLHHLVQDRGYINYKGDRFASAVGYENSMRKLIIKIGMETSIRFYQELYQMNPDDMIAYFVPDQNLEINYALLQAMR
jgi:hypothetical protein